MTSLNSLLLRVLLCVASVVAAAAVASPVVEGEGPWRVTMGRAAPWLPVVQKADTRAWLGEEVRFSARALRGPGALSCVDARYEEVTLPVEGLFQGNLPAPAATAAERLGVGQSPLPGVRVNCDRGSFDFHRVDADTLLVAVDNVIWTLGRSPGAHAPNTSAEGTVHALLQSHFAGPMEFVPGSVATKRGRLSTGLLARMNAYFVKQAPASEPPPINGDPFTDSQEYPTRFAVGPAVVENDQATVPVRFADAHREWQVRYRLVRVEGGWKVDDLNYANGGALSVWLR